MEAAVSNTPTTYPDGSRLLKDASVVLLLGLYGWLGQRGEEKLVLAYLQATLLHLTEGRHLFEEVDVLRQSAQLLHFLLDTLF